MTTTPYSLEELYERDPDYIFGEFLGDVAYQVHAWRMPDGIALDLPVYDTFEGLVKAILGCDLSKERANAIAKAEYGKCIILAAKGLAATGRLPSSVQLGTDN